MSGTATDRGDQEHMLRAVFRVLERDRVRYCVLHDYEALPAHVDSDLDLAVEPWTADTARRALERAAEEAGWEILQRLSYDVPRCTYYVMWDGGPGTGWLCVDILDDHLGIGRYGFNSGSLTQDAIRSDAYYRCSPAREVCYLLVKRTRKGSLPVEETVRMGRLLEQCRAEEIVSALSSRFGARAGRWAGAPAALSATPAEDRVVRMQRRVALLLRVERANPAKQVRRLWSQIGRLVARSRAPTGVVVALPERHWRERDSLVRSVWREVGRAFRRRRVLSSGIGPSRWLALSSATLAFFPATGRETEACVVGSGIGSDDGLTISLADELDEATRQIADGVLGILRERERQRAEPSSAS